MNLARPLVVSILLPCICCIGLPKIVAAVPDIEFVRIPDGGLQPQTATDSKGITHLVYLKGDPSACDVFYSRWDPKSSSFTPSIKVNSRHGSAVAMGTIRGAQIAVGKSGGVHVVWNGSRTSVDAGEPPDNLCYSRLALNSTGFEPQRNLMTGSKSLDGGATVAAGNNGEVYVIWHGAPLDNAGGEAGRAVFLTRSTDDGKTFARPNPVASGGACACCGANSLVHQDGTIFLAYRTAHQTVNRDATMLASRDGGNTFEPVRLQKWTVAKCPMSSFGLAQSSSKIFAAWETAGAIYWNRADSAKLSFGATQLVGDGSGQKHPRIAVGSTGDILVIWTEGTGWQKGGSLAWRLFDASGNPKTGVSRKPGIPVWSFAAAFARPDGTYAVIY